MQAVSVQKLSSVGEIEQLNKLRRKMLQQAKTLGAAELEEAWAALAASFARTAGPVACTASPG